MNDTPAMGATEPPTRDDGLSSLSKIAADSLGAAREEVTGIASEVQHQAADQFEHHRQTASKSMTDFAAAIRKAGEELEQHDQSPVARLLNQGAQSLEGLSRSLMDKKPEELMEAARTFGRENPIAFGAGAVLLGLAAGRLLRSSEQHSPSRSATGPATPPPEQSGALSSSRSEESSGASAANSPSANGPVSIGPATPDGEVGASAPAWRG